jgi:hypothetical protein
MSVPEVKLLTLMTMLTRWTTKRGKEFAWERGVVRREGV